MDIADRVRRILSTRGLTLYRVSQQSAEMFGHSSSFYIPHNLYSDVAAPSLRPNVHQVFALSRITNYRLRDWLAVFGFHLDVIPQLQVRVPRQRTALFDSSICDPQEWIPWFVDRPYLELIPPIAPLGQLLTHGAPTRAGQLDPLSHARFLYAKVGYEDSLAFPDLMAGSIIRIDARRSTELLSYGGTTTDKAIFFVDHALGFTCSQLISLGNDRVMLSSPHLPFARVELILGKELRILGVVDAELRPVANLRYARGKSWRVVPQHTQPLYKSDSPTNLKDLISRSRIRMALSFREASKITRWIAQTLMDELYFTAASTLSDYETLTTPPRHIQKIITLCILYSIGFWDFLRAGGLSVDYTSNEPIPDELIPRQIPPPTATSRISTGGGMSQRPQTGFLGTLLSQWEEIPLFLRKSVDELSGIKNLSASDVFWVGGDQDPLHPWLNRATFVVINRRIKKPVQSTGRTFWEQPLYVLLTRSRGYVCGCCTLQEGILKIHPYPDRPFTPSEFRNGTDAEVVGQITAILRRIS